MPAHPSSRLPKGNKEFYVLAAVRPSDAISVRLFRFMFRFCSKTVPERGRRALRRRSRKRSVALQELPQNAGYSLVIHACTRNNKERHPSGASLCIGLRLRPSRLLAGPLFPKPQSRKQTYRMRQHQVPRNNFGQVLFHSPWIHNRLSFCSSRGKYTRIVLNK